MSYYSKFNIVYRLQKWMDSVPGQTFLNYAYSWGASIVIAGEYRYCRYSLHVDASSRSQTDDLPGNGH